MLKAIDLIEIGCIFRGGEYRGRESQPHPYPHPYPRRYLDKPRMCFFICKLLVFFMHIAKKGFNLVALHSSNMVISPTTTRSRWVGFFGHLSPRHLKEARFSTGMVKYLNSLPLEKPPWLSLCNMVVQLVQSSDPTTSKILGQFLIVAILKPIIRRR